MTLTRGNSWSRIERALRERGCHISRSHRSLRRRAARYFTAAAPASEHSWSCCPVPPPQPIPPMTWPPRVIGVAPRVGRIWPWSTTGTTAQNPPLAAISDSSAFDRLKAAAAMALAFDVSGVKKPVPSPRAHRTRRPASSTTVGHRRAQRLRLLLRRPHRRLRQLKRHLYHSG